MKTLILGVGAFGFAILNHLAKNHPKTEFFAYEKDTFVLEYLQNHRKSPYFFPDTFLPENITFLPHNSNYGAYDIIILAIPAQFIETALQDIKHKIKKGVIFVNLAKGINNTSLKTASEIFHEHIPHATYAILSGGMIASELIEHTILGADIGCISNEIGLQLKSLFESETLKIQLSSQVKNIELYGSIKNIFALYMGYLEGKGLGMSSISYYFCELYKELPELLQVLGGENQIQFHNFALGGDLIATCFGNSRNRYFGKLVASGKSPEEAEGILKSEKKHAEGYYTLLGIHDIIQQSPNLTNFCSIGKIFIK